MTSFIHIERLRNRLYRVIEHCHGNLLDPQVIEASQTLDKALVRRMTSVEANKIRVRVHLHRGFTTMHHVAAK